MAARQGTRILVIDDQTDVLLVTARILREFEVTTLDDARSALALLRAGDRFDAIVCDLSMPHLDGQTFYETLAREFSDQAARVVFLTGGEDPRFAGFLRDVTAPVLSKPTVARALIHEVRRLAGASHS